MKTECLTGTYITVESSCETPLRSRGREGLGQRVLSKVVQEPKHGRVAAARCDVGPGQPYCMTVPLETSFQNVWPHAALVQKADPRVTLGFIRQGCLSVGGVVMRGRASKMRRCASICRLGDQHVECQKVGMGV